MIDFKEEEDVHQFYSDMYKYICSSFTIDNVL